MLGIARSVIPDAELIHGDLVTAALPRIFDGIVTWDSVFHIPRETHAAIFARLAGWLNPGGVLLLSLGGSDWEGTSPVLGHDFFYSGYRPKKNRALLEAAGFEVLTWDVDDTSSRGHLAIIARKTDAMRQSPPGA